MWSNSGVLQHQLYSGTREMQISMKNYAIQLSCKFNNSAWCYPPPFRLLRISTNKRSTRKTILSPFWCLWGLGTRLTIYVVVSLYRTYAMVKFCRCVILVVIVVLDLLSCCVHVLFAPHDVHLYVLSCVIPWRFDFHLLYEEKSCRVSVVIDYAATTCFCKKSKRRS